MNKMVIGNVPYTWTPVSFKSPDGSRGYSIIVAFPENDPLGEPIYLLDNNGTNPFGEMSHALWIPTKEVKFSFS